MPCGADQPIIEAVEHPERNIFLYRAPSGFLRLSFEASVDSSDLIGILPGITPAQLGDPSMAEAHGVQYPYICGEMANGIATVDMVSAISGQKMLAFFGAAGLPIARIEDGIVELSRRHGERGWGSNLIHSPQDVELEEKTVDLYLRRKVRRVSASAFMTVRPSVARYACTGLRKGPGGSIVRANHVFAKVSRPEVARQFLAPVPGPMLEAMVSKGQLSREEADLAQLVPVAEDITAEADSGGHTDNRPLTVLLPAILALRDEAVTQFGYDRPVRVGAAGGIGTPAAAAAAFAMGAAYVLTGSINQCTRESGQSEAAKKMLAEAGVADVMMAPAGDMFEMGVKVQVLKRGSLFPVRAAKLYDFYKQYDSLEKVPVESIRALERDIFRRGIEEVWRDTREYFMKRKPAEVQRAEREPRHRMALVFRWYLGHSSRWPLEGNAERRIDFQVWCGPAMGAFNQWVAGSFLEDPAQRTVAQIALNLMFGAASIMRAQQLRACGIAMPAAAFRYPPRKLEEKAQERFEVARV